MVLPMSSLDTLVPEGHWCILCNKASGLLRSDTQCRVLLVLRFDITHTHKDTEHTEGPIEWHTHINIHWDLPLCAHSSYLYYTEWIIRWYQKSNLQSFTMSLLFKNCPLVEVTYWLIRFNKTKYFPWNTKNADRNGAYKQNKHRYIQHSEKDKIWKG